MSTQPLSTRKKFLFSLVPLTILVLLLVGVEVALRLFTESPDAPLVTEVQYDGIRWYETNRSFLKKYFPANSPSIPEFKTSLFRKTKTPQTFRIMCLGGSTMFGTPYNMNANIPGIVRRQLRRSYPDREIEVVNWGASAINSNVIRDFAPQLLSFEPDLILIYMGHNEFYGPDGVGASFLERQAPFLTRWKYGLRNVRLVQLLQRALRSVSSGPAPSEAPNLMKQVSAGSLVRWNSPDADRIAKVFDENLRSILSTFHSSQIPVLVSEVSSNLMFAPFVSDTVALQAEARTIADALLQKFVTQDFAGVEELYQHMMRKDSTNGLLHYWYGRALLAQGRDEDARLHLARARDYDLLKFRAPSRMNEVIREVCDETGTPVVRADSLFSALSPHGIPGDSLFWEHLHPTLSGYYQIARGFMGAMITHRLLPSSPPVGQFVPLDTDSLRVCWLEQAYADLAIQHLTGRWPFENFRRVPIVLGQADAPMRELVLDVYDRKITWSEAGYRSAAYFWGIGRLNEAQTTYRAMLDEYPFSFYTNYLYGSLLNSMGERDDALVYYERSLISNPQYPKSRLDLGLIEVNRGNLDRAITELNLVLSTVGPSGPKDVRSTALYGLGAAYANKGDYGQSLQYLDEALKVLPGNADAQRLKKSVEEVAKR